MQVKYTINVQERAKPFRHSTPCDGIVPLIKAVKQELGHMETLNVIAKVNEPIEWYVGMMEHQKEMGRFRFVSKCSTPANYT